MGHPPRGSATGLPLWTAVALLVAALGAGCGGEDAGELADLGPGAHRLTIEWGGDERLYVLDVPGSYDPAVPTPLVLVMHGRPGSADGVRADSDMDSFSEDHGVLVAYPDQASHPDLARTLVEHLGKSFNVDPGRVYAAGFSAGGTTSLRFAAQASDLFAAVATIGGPFLGSPDSLPPARPVSVVSFVGDADVRWFPDVVEGLETWRAAVGCPAGEPGFADPEEKVTRITATCRDGSEVVDYRYAGMQHVWAPNYAYEVGINDTMWEFFSAHARSGGSAA